MNELARAIAKLDDCVICGKPVAPGETTEWGEPCHEGECRDAYDQQIADEWCGRQPEGIS
jgi:hypothetical protein